MTWVIVGASAGLGRALAERLAQDRKGLVLVASDAKDLEASCADLGIRFGVAARSIAFDAADHEGLALAIRSALADDEPLDGLMFPIGVVSDEDDGSLPTEQSDRLFAINLFAVMSVCTLLLPRLCQARSPVVVGFGSVAAARGRSRNVAYAAAKRALQTYFESLRHLSSARGVRVFFYVLGYMDTGLAYGKALPLPVASPVLVARRVVDDVTRGSGGVRYLPGWWAPLTAVVRLLPWGIFRRMQF